MKKTDFSNFVKTRGNFDILMDDKYNISYINVEDIIIRYNQPFLQQNEEYIKSLAEDIKNNGLDNPLIVRKINNNYDLICGRHRFLALKKLNENKIPCIVQELTDDEAEIKLINSNLNQRHNFLPSELAKAYKIKKEILQKNKSLDTVSNEKFNVYEKLAEDTNYSSKTIERYIKILALIPEFIEMVDNKKLTTNQYLQLIKLSELEQKVIYNIFISNKIKFSKITKSFIDEIKNIGVTEANILKLLNNKKDDNNSNLKFINKIFKDYGLEDKVILEIIEKLKENKYIK